MLRRAATTTHAGWGCVSVRPAVLRCPGRTLPDLRVLHPCLLGQGQSTSSSAGEETWPESPRPAPRHEPARPGLGHGRSSARMSLASRFRAEEVGLTVTGRPGPGKHIAQGWVWQSLSLNPLIAAESSPAPGCSFHRPCLANLSSPLHGGTSAVPSSCGQRSPVQDPGFL